MISDVLPEAGAPDERRAHVVGDVGVIVERVTSAAGLEAAGSDQLVVQIGAEIDILFELQLGHYIFSKRGDPQCDQIWRKF